ncbi:four helix bundle protein [bacterium]|nr:four helix bundle protein [bacterium]
MREGKAKYDLEERLIQFALMIINLIEMLPNTRTGNHMAGQLIRSGTSPAFNYGEAQVAESRDDFIHKMKICLKELISIFVKSIETARKNKLSNKT